MHKWQVKMPLKLLLTKLNDSGTEILCELFFSSKNSGEFGI